MKLTLNSVLFSALLIAACNNNQEPYHVSNENYYRSKKNQLQLVDNQNLTLIDEIKQFEKHINYFKRYDPTKTIDNNYILETTKSNKINPSLTNYKKKQLNAIDYNSWNINSDDKYSKEIKNKLSEIEFQRINNEFKQSKYVDFKNRHFKSSISSGNYYDYKSSRNTSNNDIWSNTNSKHVYVEGYYRRNGTYVQPYMRTAPNNKTNDNFSAYPNINPYTGKQGKLR
jgi:hypothetical protein